MVTIEVGATRYLTLPPSSLYWGIHLRLLELAFAEAVSSH